MGVSSLHLFRQGPVISALLRTAAQPLLRSGDAGASFEAPGPELVQTVGPRNASLVRDYIRAVGGDPSSYRGVLPPHMFPQWGFPLLGKTLAPLPYDFSRLLNAGCRIEVHHPLPADEPLQLRARLTEVDDDGRRAIFHYHLVTGTASQPDALTAKITALLPLKKGGGGKGGKKDKPRVPGDLREVDRWRLGPGAGRDFALLTGDVNPIHWLPPYARMAGFRNTILHGFGGLARLYESIVGRVLSGRAGHLKALEVRFVRPLVLPAKVGVYVGGGRCAVGDALDGPAYFTGTYEVHTGDGR